MNGPTRNLARPKYINLVVRILSNGNIILKSGGTTYEVSSDSVFVLPKSVKELYGEWNPAEKVYVTLTSYGEVLHLSDDVAPSELPFTIKYGGEGAKKFTSLLRKVLMKYYRGQSIVKLPFSDRDVFKLAVMLTRMSQLQSISDI